MFFARLRFQELKKVLVDGYKEIPYLYVTLSIIPIMLPFYIYNESNRQTNPEEYTFRHKERYVVVRPDDQRLIGYPRRFITDLHLLEKYENSQK